MLWLGNNFRYVGVNAGTTSASDGIQMRLNTSVASGVFMHNQFSFFNRAYVTQSAAGNKITFKGNMGVNCAIAPVIADSTTQSVEYTGVTGY